MSDIDLWGINTYRWDVSYTAALDFAQKSDKAMYFSEIGADSYMKAAAPGYDAGENQGAQADATRAPVGSLFSDSVPSAGVAVFSFTDGWWKAGQPDQQDVGGWAPASSGVPTTAPPTKSTGDSWTSTASPRKPTPWSIPSSTATPPHA